MSVDPFDRLLQLMDEVRRRLGVLELELHAATAALDGLPTGVLVVSSSFEIVRANRAARRIMANGDGLTTRAGLLCASRADDTVRLRGAIASALVAPGHVSGRRGVRVARPSGRSHFEVVVARVETELMIDVAGRVAAVVVLVSDTSGDHRASEALLCSLYALTPSEARVAAGIAAGCSTAEIADELGVQPNTVRAHLKAAFAKTGTRRQSELAAMVLRGPASAFPMPD